MSIRTAVSATALALVTALAMTGCAGGEDAEPEAAAPSAAGDEAAWSADTLDIDFATYNPLSLVIKDQGWLE